MGKLLRNKPASVAFVAVAVVVIALVVVIASGTGSASKPKAAVVSAAELGLSMTANKADSLGADPKAGFTMSSARDLDASQVKAALVSKPSVTLKVDQKSKRQFDITPVDDLEPDSTFAVSYRSVDTGSTLASWAYQVRAPLRIVSTLPADQQPGIGLDSGIEVTFNSDNVLNPQANVEINPPTPGRFEQHKRTLAFVPQYLQPLTLYTVTVKPGIKVDGSDATLDDAFVFQFETQNTRQTGPTPPTLTFSRSVNEIATADTPSISIQTTDYAIKKLPVQVYAYPDQKSFVADVSKLDTIPQWSSQARKSLAVPTSGLKLAMTIDATVESNIDPRQTNSGDSQPYIHFAAPMPAGLYLMQATYAGKPLQAWLEITDVATYVAVSNSKTVVWANDVAAGTPIGSAKVELYSSTNSMGLIGVTSSLGTTNDQGVLQIDTPKDAVYTSNGSGGQSNYRGSKGLILVTDAQGRSAVVPLSASATSNYNGPRADYNIGPSRDYWHFATSERPIYQTTDTVHVWGVARAREGDVKRPLQLVVSTSFDRDGQVGVPIKLQTDDYGAYEASVPLKGLGAGYYRALVQDSSGGTIDTLFFQVSDYVKPSYHIEVTPSKLAVTAGDDYDIDVKASFYDGTPVSGATLKLTNGKLDTRSFTTDADGIGHIHTVAQSTSSNGSAYDNQTLTVTPDNPEDGEITGTADIIVFPASMALRGSSSLTDGTLSLSGDASNVDLGVLTSGMQKALYPNYGYNLLNAATKPAFLTTPVANASVSIDMTETHYNRTEIGDRYDFINKTTSKVYKYDNIRNALPTVTVTTDAQGKFTYSTAALDGSSYDIKVSIKDAQGRITTLQAYAYNSSAGPGQSSNFATVSFDSPSNNDKHFTEGEKVAVDFKRGGNLTPAGGKNRYLFYEAQRGIKKVAVQDSPVYNATFGADSIPSVVIGGVYFNGSTYLEVPISATLRFDPTAKALNIALSTAKDTYGPGDEATVKIAVTDAAGKPVQAEVNLAAVDASVFDLVQSGISYTDVLQDLYASLPSGIIHTYSSHQYPVDLGGAGGKGGGGGGAWQDFTDVAYFGTVKTDSSGKAEAKFKLPDNLTSWRLTAYGMTKDLQTGRAQGSLPVTQQFFVDVSANDDYLATDRPQIRARGFGSALKAGDAVSVSLTAPSLGLKDPTTVSGRAFEAIALPLPPLKAGEYDLRIEATSGSQKDVVIKHISVVPSRLLAPVIDYKGDVKAGDSLMGAKDGQTSVVFSDAGRGRLLPALQRLRWSYGDRLDQTLARVMSVQMLNEYFGQGLSVEDFTGALYLDTGPKPAGSTSLAPKGVSMLPQASPDVTATALVAALAPGSFGGATLRDFLQPVVDDSKETSERQAIAYYGLASLGEPVLLQLQDLSKATDLGWRGRLYLALAYKAAGDDASARKQIDSIAKDFNEDQTPAKRLRVGSDQDDILEATSLMAVLEAGIDNSAADAYFAYLQKDSPLDTPDFLQQLLYLQTALTRGGTNDVSFNYTLGGKKSAAALTAGKTLTLSLSPDELSGLKLDSIKGSLSATTTYLAPMTAQEQKASPDLTIRRTYAVVDSKAAPGAPIPANAEVEVTLAVTFGDQAVNDCYQVTDLLPSGLKPVTRLSFVTSTGPTAPKTNVIRPNQIDGQRVTFCVPKGNTMRFTYFARVTGTGTFTWEPAVINARSTPSVIAVTQSTSVQTQ